MFVEEYLRADGRRGAELENFRKELLEKVGGHTNCAFYWKRKEKVIEEKKERDKDREKEKEKEMEEELRVLLKDLKYFNNNRNKEGE